MTWRDVPCREWSGAKTARGYGARKYEGKVWTLHRLQWTQEKGPIPDGLQVLHRCDNRPCYEIRHLFLGTVQDNMQDMVSKGRQPRGETNGHSKLTADEVRLIRSRYAAGGVTQQALGDEYGIAESTVCGIVKGKRWTHV